MRHRWGVLVNRACPRGDGNGYNRLWQEKPRHWGFRMSFAGLSGSSVSIHLGFLVTEPRPPPADSVLYITVPALFLSQVTHPFRPIYSTILARY